MKIALIIILVALCAALAAGIWLQLSDRLADRREISRLLALQPAKPALFDPAIVADLPKPARDYFNFTIAPGTPLRTVAIIRMSGLMGLGTKADPNYRDMEAEQHLAAPEGFVWQVRSGIISGTDATAWGRFRLLGVVPVGRGGGDADFARSAFGRYVAEAVFWTPAALLPSEDVTWQAVNENTARVTITHNGMTQSVDVVIGDGGRPVEVSLQRWTNANADKEFRLQPFGGTLSEFREIDGFTIPFHVEGGNMFGTEDYFPFFIADVRSISFPEPVDARKR